MKSPTGGSQYARWTANKGPWAEPSQAGQQSRSGAANTFRAWEHMKPGAAPTRGTTGATRGVPNPGRGAAPPPEMSPRSRPGRPATFANSTGNSGPQATPKAQAGWDQFEHNAPPPGMTRAKTMRSPRKSGFDPGVLDGDEPQARNTSAYYNMHGGSVPHARPQPFQPRPAQPGPENPGAPRPQDPFKGFRSPQKDGFGSPKNDDNYNDRLSTPYATTGGERTYFSSEGLSRNPSSGSASNLKSGWEAFASATSSPRSPNHERHRSASPRMRTPNPPHSSSSSGESSDEDIPENAKLRSKGFGAQSHGMNGATQNKHMPPPPKPSVTIEDPSGKTFEFGRPVKRSTWSAQESHGDSHHSRNLSADQAAFRRTSTGGLQEAGNKPKSHGSNKGSMPPSPLHTATPLTNDADDFEPLEKTTSWQETFGYQKDASNCRHFDPPVCDSGQQPKYDPFLSFLSFLKNKENQKTHVLTSLPSDIAQSHLGANLCNVLPNLRDHLDDVQPPSLINWDKGSLNAMINKANRSNNSTLSNTTPQPTSSPKHGANEKPTSQFSQHDWQQKFSDDSANPFHPPPNLTAESRGRASPIKARPVGTGKTPRKMSTASKWAGFTQAAPASEASADNSDEEVLGAARVRKSKSADRASAGSAMDIDSNSPSFNAEMKSTHNPLGNTIRSQAPANKTPPVSSATSPATGPKTNGGHFNMSDIKSSTPLATSNSNGLHDIGDLGANLPFPSKPASTLPTVDIHPHNLALPPPPKPPKAPTTKALTRKDYDYYMIWVRKYMAEWNMFNQQMLGHFNARQHKIENDLPKNWLDGMGQDGLLRYMAWMDEDIRVRAHWEVSYERHIEAMKTLGEIKKVAIAGKWAA